MRTSTMAMEQTSIKTEAKKVETGDIFKSERKGSIAKRLCNSRRLLQQ